jgi:molybdate transport system substrate-binding protein
MKGRRFVIGLAVAALAIGPFCQPSHTRTPPPPLSVLVSGGFGAALDGLAPRYARATGGGIAIARGPSMGQTPQAIPARLARREAADVVILAREALDRLAASGEVDPASVTDLALSRIAVAVRKGAPRPDIGSEDALRRTLLAAKSIAYSDSASGVYLSTQLFPRLGIAERIAGKVRMIPATPVGEIVARGDAEIGFQQLSELKPVAGITIVGLIPESTQKVTRFSAGVVSYSARKEAARRLIAFLASRKAWAVVERSGMTPAGRGRDMQR